VRWRSDHNGEPSWLAKRLLRFIDRYQARLRTRPIGVCKFVPSCSNYARQAIGEYGALIGLAMSWERVMRCNRWAIGGPDPVRPRRLPRRAALTKHSDSLPSQVGPHDRALPGASQSTR
jgi:uncharacterized protein